ncbi:hypothetical protein EG835_10870, partial [bacterium]|nr:hypothetical protein [bacterium]
GIGAGVTGLIAPKSEKRPALMLAAVAAGIVTLTAGTAAAQQVLSPTAVPIGSMATAALTSLVVALAYVAVWEYVFPKVIVKQSAAVRPGTMSTEDADVDELLRLIATAEDELASKHTTQATVMITDMKSFSKMTEEEGSFVSAKTIQRHRDLLLPVIEKHGGHGKSTGGDGLVAAFQSPTNAVTAATEMQALLRERNATHASERAIIIRIGIAMGEVVLDKGGRPFIGNGLNMAARIMNLGDGGQVFVSRDVADALGEIPGVRTADHGDYTLKNIAEPVRLVEVLWADDQEPTPPLIQRD